ncbi:MAG: hypothetical protein WDM90_04140 [Ferruginibacter sp.]
MKYTIRRARAADVTAIYNFICLLEETIFDYEIFQSIFFIISIQKAIII